MKEKLEKRLKQTREQIVAMQTRAAGIEAALRALATNPDLEFLLFENGKELPTPKQQGTTE